MAVRLARISERIQKRVHVKTQEAVLLREFTADAVHHVDEHGLTPTRERRERRRAKYQNGLRVGHVTQAVERSGEEAPVRMEFRRQKLPRIPAAVIIQ